MGYGSFQRLLDWLTSPTIGDPGPTNREEAEVCAIVFKGYWEAIALRDAVREGNIVQNHLHLQGDVDPKVLKKISKKVIVHQEA